MSHRKVLLAALLLPALACGPTDDTSPDRSDPDASASGRDARPPGEDVELPEEDAGEPEEDGGIPGEDAETPRDAAPLPPANAEGVLTNFASSVAFLYGPGGVQTGVAPGAIDQRRVSVLRGRVTDRAGAPIAAVAVGVLGSPQLGRTETQSDGTFDIAVNGGGRVTIALAKDGFLPMQRTVDAPWTDWAIVEEVVMTPLDPTPSVVALGAASPAQIARGTMSMDGDGMRQASVIFPPGTTAELVMPDGSTAPFAGGMFRATEFTVGDKGLEAMPAALPPASGYTYAVEYSFDEALAAGAASVRFNQPVVAMVDNFLALPAGELVPVGYYDRRLGQWVPAPNGVVVDLLGVDQGLATVDADGNGMPDDAALLAQLGFTDDERSSLAMIYPAGGSIWRAVIDHFTPWDYNWPIRFPPGAFPPPDWDPSNPYPYQPCGLLGSFVDCEGQTLREYFDITGTPFTLVYQSDRTPGRSADDTVKIPLTGDELPPEGFAGIELRATIAGQKIFHSPAPAPNLTFEYTWDHLDGYGRPVQGPRTLTGAVAFVYENDLNRANGGNSQSFGEQGSPAAGTFNARREDRRVEMVRPFSIELGSDGPDARDLGLGGWTLNLHHVLDPTTGTVFLGSGGRKSGESIVQHLAGIEGSPFTIPHGAPAASTPFQSQEHSLHVGPDGSVYFLDRNRIYRLDPEGIYHRVVGCDGLESCETNPPIEDGRRAGSVALGETSTGLGARLLSIGPGGHIAFAISLTGWESVWVIDPDGTVRRVAGRTDMRRNNPMNGQAQPLIEGTVARDEALNAIIDLAVGADGSVYFVQQVESLNQIWRVGRGGLLAHVAGIQTYGVHCQNQIGTDELNSVDKCFDIWRDLAVDRAGNVYIAARGTIWRARPDGIVQRWVGLTNDINCDTSVAELPRLDACMASMRELRIGPDDQLYVNVLLDNGRGGIIRASDAVQVVFGGGTTTALGASARMFSADRGRAGWGGFAIDPRGNIVVRDVGLSYERLLRVVPSTIVDGDRYLVPSDDGRMVWVFDLTGRHVATRDIFTGATMLAFDYTTEGKLASVTDRHGLITRIERDAGGLPSAIIAPTGARTSITLDANGWISKLESPSGAHVDMTYVNDGGLLATFSDQLQRGASFTWDGEGRLASETTRLGGQMTLARMPLELGGHQVTMTADGRSTVFQTMILERAISRSVIDASGAVTSVVAYEDGTRQVYGTEGTVTAITEDVDPRLPLRYTKSLVVTKGMLGAAYETRRTLAEGTGIFGSGTFTQDVTSGGKTWSIVLDGAARTMTETTPAGRTRTTTFDALGRAVSVNRGAGLAPYTLTYGATGLIESFDAAGATYSFEHDANRRVSAVIDPRKRTDVVYDADGRPTSITDPTGTHTLAFDAAGAISGFALPGGAMHALAGNAHEAYTSYTPPGATNAYRRVYDDVRGGLEQIILPSGRAQTYTTAPEDRFSRIAWPEATVDFTWGGAADLPATITRTPASGMPQATTFTWQNSLPVTVETSGATSGTWNLTFGPEFQAESSAFTSGGDSVSNMIGYDDDGRVTQYGPVTYVRTGPDRLIGQVAFGSAHITYVYDSAGRVAAKTVHANGADRYSLAVSWDPMGIVLDRAETAGGTTENYVHTHDATGRLERVSRGGTEIENYAYDERGNRTSATSSGVTGEAATYDAQDRILTRGASNYVIDQDGFLASRGGDSFVYSAAGELISANIGGTAVTYEYDAFRRLVRRTQGGQSTQFYYADPFFFFRPSAYRAPGEALTSLYYDGSGHLAAMARGTARWIVAADQVGSPRLVIEEATGNTVKAIVRDSFGRLVSDSNPSFVLPIGFAGGIEDERTGLVRFGYRDYEPAAGRWTARDPILLAGGQFNLYAYVGSSPSSFRDPLGLFCLGGSAYAGLGGGAKICFDKKGLSACAELGFGLGGALDVQPWGKIDGNTFGFEGGAKVGLGPASFGCEGTLAVDFDKSGGASPCALVKDGDCKGGIMGAEMSLIKGQEGDTIGLFDIVKTLTGDDPAEGYERGSAALQAKGAVKGCQNIGWNLF